MLRPVGPEEMGDGYQRKQDRERDPVGALDGLGPAEGSDQRDRREDDHQFEPRRIAAEPTVEWMLRMAHVTPRTVRRPASARVASPDRVTDPSNE